MTKEEQIAELTKKLKQKNKQIHTLQLKVKEQQKAIVWANHERDTFYRLYTNRENQWIVRMAYKLSNFLNRW